MMTPFAMTFIGLLIGHAIADSPQMNRDITRAKRRHLPEGANGRWIEALGLHAAVHGAFVGFVTGSVTLALFEFMAHAVIDCAKCEGYIGTWVDQTLHVACKVLWVILLTGGFR